MKKIAFLDLNGTLIVRFLDYYYKKFLIYHNMKKQAFVDRDGTLIAEPKDIQQINGLERLVLKKGVISGLRRLQKAGFELIVVSNQDGLGTAENPTENYELVNKKLKEIFASEEIYFSNWLTCPHYEEDNCECRKPKIGLVKSLENEIDKEKSVMIGDRDTDIEFAKNLGIRGFKITDNYGWKEIVDDILQRKASVKRETKETKIDVELNIDGSGKSEINTGLGFFNHMLEQVAKHGKFDLKIDCKGDLNIDEHHTIEDVALALGECFANALGDKKGIARFASERFVPMDESLSYVAIDISGRPFCVFDAKFEREYVGDMPTEMVEHFFQSFAVASKISLNIKIDGRNTHHKIESCFKDFGKILYDASRIVDNNLPSTKGVL